MTATAIPVPVAPFAAVVRCYRCNRHLRNEASIAAGIGPTCARREALETTIALEAARGNFSVTQATTTLEAFADNAVALATEGTYPHALVVATDGVVIHRVTLASLRCDPATCEAAHHSRRCWHQLAAAVALSLNAPPVAPVAA